MEDSSKQSAQTELTYGEKSVGLKFNPSSDTGVDNCKRLLAKAIDQMQDVRSHPLASDETRRLASIAITELQGAQMWAVKAITWKD